MDSSLESAPSGSCGGGLSLRCCGVSFVMTFVGGALEGLRLMRFRSLDLSPMVYVLLLIYDLAGVGK